ncbi:hypothetical protein K523DRAFT_324592 [Schizophyllum commune Tattone D]|nr:hypothetical protein K523DRAFT_324592 [Schizophyllum commune Tattone D]
MLHGVFPGNSTTDMYGRCVAPNLTRAIVVGGPQRRHHGDHALSVLSRPEIAGYLICWPSQPRVH